MKCGVLHAVQQCAKPDKLFIPLQAFFYYGGGSYYHGRGAFRTTAVQRRALPSFFASLFNAASQEGEQEVPKAAIESTPAQPSSWTPTTTTQNHSVSASFCEAGALPRPQRREVRHNQPEIRANAVNSVSAFAQSWGKQRYEFPVGRALRFLRRGQCFFDWTEGQEAIAEWLAVNGKRNMVDDDCVSGTTLGGRVEEGGSPPAMCGAEDEVEQIRKEVSQFTKYHAHHVLVEFKKLRRHLSHHHYQRQQRQRRQHQPTTEEHCDGGASQHRDALPHTTTGSSSQQQSAMPSPRSKLSTQDMEELTRILFAATVLLHLGGLFSVADTHVEPLLEVCFSVTIFLAQDAATVAQQGSGSARRGDALLNSSCTSSNRRDTHLNTEARQKRSQLTPGTLSSVSEGSDVRYAEVRVQTHKADSAPQAFVLQELGRGYLHSLHWSIVHFAAAVQRWGLLEHTRPLQSIRKTQRPYERLLQAHAALLCDLVRRCVDPVVWRELLLLKSGQRAPAAQAAWFLSADEDDYKHFFGSVADVHALTCVPARLQGRRLQLLPMLWLSLLISQLSPHPHHHHRHDPHELSLGKDGHQVAEGSGIVADGQRRAAVATGESQQVDMGSARHAFAALLPLFTKDAGYDVTVWALLHFFFVTSSSVDHGACHLGVTETAASLTETCALLARMEQSGAALELGGGDRVTGMTRAPRQTSFPALSFTPAVQHGIHAHLAHALRRFIDATAAGVPHTSATCPSLSVHARSTLSSLCHTNATRRQLTKGEALVRGYGVPPTTIRRPVQLYRALLNIPLCTLSLPPSPFTQHIRSASPAAQAPSPSLAVTADGVCVVNALLLRVLVQWRADPAAPKQPRREPAIGIPSDTARDTAKGGDAAAVISGGKNKGGALQGVAIAAQVEWERDVFSILQAANHLQQLLHATTATCFHTTGSDSAATALHAALLVPTVQAAARALAEQVGVSLFPRRLAMVKQGRCPLLHTEQLLLLSLDEALQRIIRKDVSGTETEEQLSTGDAGRASLVGTLPRCYQASFSELLACAKR
jgi:hypothetical protein